MAFARNQLLLANEKLMDAILKDVKGAYKNWKTEATKIGIPKSEIALMSSAFKI